MPIVTPPVVFSVLQVVVLQGLGAQQLQEVPLDWLGTGYCTIATMGDLDGDGIADLVVSRQGNLTWRRGVEGAPKRRFADEETRIATVGLTCESAGRPALVDVDADGDLDLLTADRADETTWTPHPVCFANDGKGAFAAGEPLRNTEGGLLMLDGATESVALFDFDGDSRRDVVATARACFVHRGLDRGFATAAQRTATALQSPVVCDHDRDGDLDLVGIVRGDVVLLERGPTGFEVTKKLAAVAGVRSRAWVDVVDWDGDGALDLLLSEHHLEAVARETLTDDELAHLAAAERILAAIGTERAMLNRSKPPRDDDGAMRYRETRRRQFDEWAAGPTAVREALHPRRASAKEHRSAVRVVLQR